MCSWLRWLERWLAGLGGWCHAWGPRFNPRPDRYILRDKVKTRDESSLKGEVFSELGGGSEESSVRGSGL